MAIRADMRPRFTRHVRVAHAEKEDAPEDLPRPSARRNPKYRAEMVETEVPPEPNLKAADLLQNDSQDSVVLDGADEAAVPADSLLYACPFQKRYPNEPGCGAEQLWGFESVPQVR